MKGTQKQRVALVEKYLHDEISLCGAAKEAKVATHTFANWVCLYEQGGASALKPIRKYQHHSRIEKLHAVWDYLEGKGSLREIAQKYQLRSKSVLERWLKVYHKEGDFKPDKGEDSMNKDRKTTQEERYQIVQDCLKQGMDYHGMAAKYQVSYQKIYQWVKKYQEMGYAGLEDRRGKRKRNLSARTPEEKMQIEIAQLKRHNEYLRMERDLLKKIQEYERRDRWDNSDN